MHKQSLDDATDVLTEALSDAEDLLAALRLGVPAQVPLPDGRGLCFGKVGKQWRLYVASSVEGEDPQILASASRHTRVWAAESLPALLQALRDAQVAHHAEVVCAAEKVRAFNAALRAEASAP